MAKISQHLETTKRKMLKDVKGFEIVILSTSTRRGHFCGVWTKK